MNGNSLQRTGGLLMAVDLHGVRNVGDFFAQHYLDQLLKRDLKERLDT